MDIGHNLAKLDIHYMKDNMLLYIVAADMEYNKRHRKGVA